MANIPATNTTGITGGETLLGQIFSYLNGLSPGGAAPQVPMTGLPTTADLGRTKQSLLRAPMTALPGGGADPSTQSGAYSSGVKLAGNPATANILDTRRQAELGIEGQNLGLQQSNLFNTQTMQQMIEMLMGGTAGQLGQIGTYPPMLRGLAQSTAASGTGSGGGGLLGMFGL